SLRRAKELALRVSCLSQTHNTGRAAMQHAGERERLPLAGLQWGISSFTPAGLGDPSEHHYLYYTDSTNSDGTADVPRRRVAPMVAQLGQYMGLSFRTDSRESMEEDLGRDEVTRTFGCPAVSASERQEGKIVLGKYNGWRNPILEPSAYGFNEGILGHRGASEHAVSDEAPAGQLDWINHTNETLLSLESKPWEGEDSLVFFDLGPRTSYWDYWQFARDTGYGTTVEFDRHAHHMNAVFADGHSESLETGESVDEPAIDVWEKIYVLH
ncbi:MAG: hypothetical protein KGY81_07855, partial [Phycisphaerae bacterium]|nr:hypothetical protein [Phycisphaerae bacterium]